jgi:hypothetical protein
MFGLRGLGEVRKLKGGLGNMLWCVWCRVSAAMAPEQAVWPPLTALNHVGSALSGAAVRRAKPYEIRVFRVFFVCEDKSREGERSA